MNSDLENFHLFVARWAGSPDYKPILVPRDELKEAEQELETLFPERYVQFLSEIGSPNITIDLLDKIADDELDIPDLSEFFLPNDVVESTRGWRELGLRPDLIAFASDGLGNKFAFEVTNPDQVRPVTSRIWFYDHDFGTHEVIAVSFDAWIDSYNSIPEY